MEQNGFLKRMEDGSSVLTGWDANIGWFMCLAWGR